MLQRMTPEIIRRCHPFSALCLQRADLYRALAAGNRDFAARKGDHLARCLPLVALWDLEEKGKDDPMLAELAKIVKKNNGLWSPEAEKYLLANAKPIA